MTRRAGRETTAHPSWRVYLEQIKLTVALAGAVEADELTPDAKEDLSELYRRWRADG